MDKKDLDKKIRDANKRKTKLKKDINMIKKTYINRRKKNRINIRDIIERRKKNFEADKAETNQMIYYNNKIKEEVFDPISPSNFSIYYNNR
jgi:hypothetical protein